MTTQLDVMVRAYLRCALWTGTDDNDEPLDAHCGADDWAPEALASARADCEAFMSSAGALLDALPDTYGSHPDFGRVHRGMAAAGHDLWLTRCGHGVGFWDRDLPGSLGDDLSDLAEKMGDKYVYIGDDACLHLG